MYSLVESLLPYTRLQITEDVWKAKVQGIVGKEESKIQNKKDKRINKILSVSNWVKNTVRTNVFACLGQMKHDWNF